MKLVATFIDGKYRQQKLVLQKEGKKLILTFGSSQLELELIPADAGDKQEMEKFFSLLEKIL